MSVDVTVEVVIARAPRSRGIAATRACDPGNDTSWYANIREVR